MRVMLLTDIPPCENYTAGLVLDRLVRFYPADQIALCSVVNSAIHPVIPSDLSHLPSLVLQKPREASLRLLPGWAGAALAYVFEIFQSIRTRCVILPKIAKFAHENRIEAIWVILQGQTMIRLALPLAKKLGVPLYSQVWDPFSWWLRDNRIDVCTQRRLQARFDETISQSAACATASWAMSEYYDRRYGTRNLPLIASLPRELMRESADSIHTGSEFVIGMAGQFYASAEWNCLIETINKANWKIAGRCVRIRVMGGSFKMSTQSVANFEFLGWQTQAETIRLLAETDLLYLPYWFSEEFREESSNSFPGKLVTYFAAGRPVLCHAPKYASPAKYIVEHDAGYLCDSLDPTALLQMLEHVIADTMIYAKHAQKGSECFLRDFTLERMEETFSDFLLNEKSVPDRQAGR